MSVDFVEKVDANIKNSTFEITFKPRADVDFDKLKNKVEDAGFFVADFRATIHFDNMKIKNDALIESTGKNFMFLHVAEQELNGDQTVKTKDICQQGNTKKTTLLLPKNVTSQGLPMRLI